MKSSTGARDGKPGAGMVKRGFLVVFLLFTAMAVLGLFLNMGRLIFMKIEHPRSTGEMLDK